MSTEYFSKDFADQFRQEYALYTPLEEYQHGNLLFMQVAGIPEEIEILAISVTKKLYHAPFIYRLINKLKNEDIQQVSNLCAAVKDLCDEFHVCIQNESYTSGYYNDLIATLDSCYDLASALKKDICIQVSYELKRVYTGLHEQRSGFDLKATYPYAIAEEIGYYLKNMLVYYNHFVVTWQNEKDNNKGIQLTTQVSDYLSELINVIEQVICGMEDTLDLFLTWEAQMDIMEDQALFN
jgi:hypothetical protein